jgi:PIN domain nuclease of toxin-antitoxin system
VRLLIDTHIFIVLSKGQLEQRYPKLATLIDSAENELYLSVASIWEIAIKVRLGKLDAGVAPEFISEFCESLGVRVLAIDASHATAELSPEPYTRDPFDRMLLAQCSIEGMRLVTVDQHLAEHPLAIR